jgi:hypothetical protein
VHIIDKNYLVNNLKFIQKIQVWIYEQNAFIITRNWRKN